MNEPLISALIAIPAGAAILCAVLPRLARWVALVGALATAGALVVLGLDGALSGATRLTVIKLTQLAPTWYLRLDGLAVPLVVLTAFLTVVAVLASWDVSDRPGAHHALLMVLSAAVMGVFLADDLVLFYVFWEAVLIPMYFLIGIWGHERRRHAALKFFLYTFLASGFMLVGILIIVFTLGETRISALPAILPFASEVYPEFNLPLVFWLLVAGMLVKIPVVPFHTWLPDAHVEAPTAGSIMLAGVLLKMGGYGLLRIAVPFAPDVAESAAGVFAALGIVGIVYGAFMALAQQDLKRLVAYSSVAHMGFVVLGIAVGTEAGYTAAMLGMVSHGVVSGLLFLLVGQLYERTHTRELSRFGGLGALVPGWATVFTFAALASLGLPGLSGFPGEFLAIIEGYRAFEWWILVATVGVVLAAAYNLRAVWAVNQRGSSGEWVGMSDLRVREWIPVVLLVVAILALGVWPRFVSDVAQPVIALIVNGGM